MAAGSLRERVLGRIGRAKHPCHAVVHAVVVGVGIEGDTGAGPGFVGVSSDGDDEAAVGTRGVGAESVPLTPLVSIVAGGAGEVDGGGGRSTRVPARVAR